MDFLQRFHLVIKYKRGVTNKLVDVLPRPPLRSALGTISQVEPFVYVAYSDGYALHCSNVAKSTDFKPKEMYYIQGHFLYKLGKLFVANKGSSWFESCQSLWWFKDIGTCAKVYMISKHTSWCCKIHKRMCFVWHMQAK